jgi:hypothetical protein
MRLCSYLKNHDFIWNRYMGYESNASDGLPEAYFSRDKRFVSPTYKEITGE